MLFNAIEASARAHSSLSVSSGQSGSQQARLIQSSTNNHSHNYDEQQQSEEASSPIWKPRPGSAPLSGRYYQ
ncbi:protein still life [Tropilaelaps mercedesae]|uniref:Protein still life n=1 Tax=Tropilaelaps mercedesae TaxID=418985 RepID=A0A1V9XKZ6_9ACAR|nr:protein still life [Tropilaelaps mercedesae]